LVLALLLVAARVYAPAYGVFAELLVAACVSVWAFGSDERPLVHEAHELGIGPRAVVQAAACAVVALVLSFERELAVYYVGYAALQAVIATVALFPLVIPAWVETRERANARRLKRDAWAALLMLVAGFAALELMNLAYSYTSGLSSSHSIPGALDLTREDLVWKLHNLRLQASYLALALVFVGSSLARLHEARPRTVFAAAIASGVVANVGNHLVMGLPTDIRVNELLDPSSDYIFFAFALSLGPAFGDKLTRKIERRMPKSHSHD
jgi:hypothetical protein